MPSRLALNVETRSRPSRSQLRVPDAGGERQHGERRRGAPVWLWGLAARTSRRWPRAPLRRPPPRSPSPDAGERAHRAGARPSDPRRARAVERARIDMPPHVGRERAGRRVAALRLLPQRREHDVVEPARQPLSQSPRLGTLQVHALVVDRRIRVEVAHHRVRRRLRRLLEAPSRGDAPRRIAAPVRMPAGEQLVEDRRRASTRRSPRTPRRRAPARGSRSPA